MSEKEKQELLEQIDKLTPMEFTKLCLKVIKKIVKKNNNEIIDTYKQKEDKEVLIDLIIKNDIKIKDKL